METTIMGYIGIIGYMGGCQNYGPFLGTLDIRDSKRNHDLTTTHIYIYIYIRTTICWRNPMYSRKTYSQSNLALGTPKPQIDVCIYIYIYVCVCVYMYIPYTTLYISLAPGREMPGLHGSKFQRGSCNARGMKPSFTSKSHCSGLRLKNLN